jgi:hypothetical protein
MLSEVNLPLNRRTGTGTSFTVHIALCISLQQAESRTKCPLISGHVTVSQRFVDN